MARRKIQRTEPRMLWDEDPGRIPLKKCRRRAVVLATVVVFFFAAVFVRLVDLMVLDHEKLSKRAAQQYSREKTLEQQRGVIWDRRMRDMVTNIETESLYAMPSKVENTATLSRELGPIIRLSSKEINMTLLKKKERDFIWLARKIDDSAARKVMSLKERIGSGEIGFITESRRYYPKGRTASHILGFTNIDNKGISGLELMYDEYLHGETKNVSFGTDARGNRLAGDLKESTPGNNIMLTIDEGIQYIVESELSEALKKWKARAAVAVMMNPSTGEILAMASRPDYNPNSVGGSHVYKQRNRAVTDLYEPGSTLKTILAAAAIEEKTARKSDLFDVSKGYIVVGGKAVRDVHRNKVITFEEVFQKSSNVGSVMIGQKLGADKYYKYLKGFGFGEKTGIDFPGEVRGIFRKREDWSGTSLAALSIGQEIGVTPLQVLKAYAAIANSGVVMKPYLVSDIISPTGQMVKRVSPVAERRIVSEETADKVKDILKTVVREGGTATKAYINGNLVAGKTGTAQIFDPKTGRYSKDKFVSSFVGFVPADNPMLALIVVVYEPDGATYGGVVAAPVFKNIVERTFMYMDVPVEDDVNRIIFVRK